MNGKPTDDTIDVSLVIRKAETLKRLFLVIVSLQLVLFGGVCTEVVVLIPKLERIFSEILGDKPLPLLTESVIRFGRGFEGFLPFLFSTVSPLLTLLFLMLNRNRPVAWILAVGMILLLALFIALISAGLFIPLSSIISAMNSQ